MTDWYEKAKRAERKGKLQSWAVEFLNESGNNSKLASVIEERGHLHIGLINYPLQKLKSEVGVGEKFKWPEDESKYNSRTNAMLESLKKVGNLHR